MNLSLRVPFGAGSDVRNQHLMGAQDWLLLLTGHLTADHDDPNRDNIGIDIVQCHVQAEAMWLPPDDAFSEGTDDCIEFPNRRNLSFPFYDFR
jgi:hypothetical protein